MTNRFFNKSEELQRLHEGPLGRHIDDYAALLVEGGYLRTPARVQLRLIADFSRWLQLRRLKANDLNQQKIEQYLKERKRSVRIKLGDAACLRRLLKLLRDLGIADHKLSTIPAGEYERLADAFQHYLFKERSLAPKTVVDQLLMARRFLLECFGGGSLRLDQLCAVDVTCFVQRHAYDLSHGRTRALLTYLRTFLQYLFWRGEIRTNLAACVPSVMNRRFATLPKSLPANQVELVLSHCDRRVAMGKRDYAILLLLARLGLRAGEVSALRLADINWEAGEFTICGKGKRMARLPLPQEIGEAIADYLKHGRPRCATRHLFVRLRAPIVGLANSIAISSIVRRALARGADPYKFAELREVGLINEQINWKQRFFVPSDENSGMDILESLLERYPVMLTEDMVSDDESNMVEIPPQAEIRATEIVDLDEWIVAVGKATPEQQTADGIDRQLPEQETGTEEGQPFTLTQVAAVSWTQLAQKEQAQLAFSFG